MNKTLNNQALMEVEAKLEVFKGIADAREGIIHAQRDEIERLRELLKVKEEYIYGVDIVANKIKVALNQLTH